MVDVVLHSYRQEELAMVILARRIGGDMLGDAFRFGTVHGITEGCK